MEKPVVLSTREDAMIDPATRQYVAAIKVTYRIGDQGPFSVSIPKATFTAAAVNAEMAKVAAELAQLGS